LQEEEKKNLLSNADLSKGNVYKAFTMPIFDGEESLTPEPKEVIESLSQFDTGFVNLEVLLKSGFRPEESHIEPEASQDHDDIIRPFAMRNFHTSELHARIDMIDIEEDVIQVTQADIDAKMQEAFALGHKEGFEKGFEKGRAEGFKAGRLEGLPIGKKEGFESSKQEGYQVGAKDADSLLQRFSVLIKEFDSFGDKMVSSLEPKVLELSFAIAKKIIFDQLSSHPETIITLAREALKKITKSGKIVIKINPKLHDLFMEKKAELLDIHPDIVFDVDPSLSNTGFLVTGTEDEILVDIDKMINDIKEELSS
jgi:flagellar assembly protein FliH